MDFRVRTEESVAMEQKGILFILGGWAVGGAERVTAVLADEFAKRGWRVGIAVYQFEDKSLLSGIDQSIRYLEMAGKRFSSENVAKLRNFISKNGFDYVINGWCSPYSHTKFIRRAIASMDVKLVALHHNVPNMNNRIAKAHNPILKKAFQFVSAFNLYLVYRKCDAYVVLSECFKRIFMDFTKVRDASKLHAISNPLTLTPLPPREKENAILYVGRLEETQKRVSRVIEVWKMLSVRFPDWRLDVVGDGPDRASYEELAKGIDRITFHGFRNPSESYVKSKILLLTSDFEGFPLVLAEALAAKCVPLALGTYPSVHDIINGANGIVAMPPFETERFSETLADMLNHPDMVASMADVGSRIGKLFSVGKIVDQWEALLEGL